MCGGHAEPLNGFVGSVPIDLMNIIPGRVVAASHVETTPAKGTEEHLLPFHGLSIFLRLWTP